MLRIQALEVRAMTEGVYATATPAVSGFEPARLMASLAPNGGQLNVGKKLGILLAAEFK